MLNIIRHIWHWLADPYVYTCPHGENGEMCEECLHHWAIK